MNLAHRMGVQTSMRPISVFGRLLFAATLAMGVVVGQVARAAAVETHGSLDWSGFSWSFTGAGLTWSDFSQSVEVSFGDSSFLSTSQEDWTSGTSVTVSNGLGTATVLIEPTDVPGAGVPSGQIAADIVSGPQEGLALALRGATITAVGAGTVQFSVPYTLGLAFSEAAAPVLLGEAHVELAVYDGNLLVDSVFDSLASSPSGTPGGDTLSRVGSLDFAVVLNDGESLDFLASAEGSVGVVPLPAPVWLFGSALLALGFLGRARADRG